MLTELSGLALPAVAAVVGIALCAYAAGYQRHFVRIPRSPTRLLAPAALVPRARESYWTTRCFRTPFQKGCFRFICKTLLRSEAHRLVLTAIGGLGLVLASQALMDAFESAKSWRQAMLSTDALSIPFILCFLGIISLRLVFEIPADLRSNWIFQLMLDQNGEECEPLARKVILDPGVALATDDNILPLPVHARLGYRLSSHAAGGVPGLCC